MNEGPEIDGSLPGQEVEDELSEEEIRREVDAPESPTSDSESWELGSDAEAEESLRGWLYLVAGAGYGLLVVYLVLVIWLDKPLPILSEGEIPEDQKMAALATALLISAMVYITIWFFMSGKKHSYFTEDPDKAKFYAGIIGLASLVIIALSWADYSREMIVSAILTSVSTWSYIRSSQMKA